MARIARAVSDIRVTDILGYNGGWTTQWQMLANHPLDYSSYAQTTDTPTALKYSESKLAAIADPGTSSKHYIRYALSRSNVASTIDGTVELRQGTTLIATRTIVGLAATAAVPKYRCIELTGAETDAITDYSDLRLRFYGVVTGGTGATGMQIWYGYLYVAEPTSALVQASRSDTFSGASIGPNWDVQAVRDGSTASQVELRSPATVAGETSTTGIGEIAIVYWAADDFPTDQQFSEAVYGPSYVDANSAEWIFVNWTDNPDYGMTNYRVDWQWTSARWEIKLTGNGVGTGTVLAFANGVAPAVADVSRIEARWNASLSRVDYTGTLTRASVVQFTITASDATGTRLGRPGWGAYSVSSGAKGFTSWAGGAIDAASSSGLTSDDSSYRRRRKVAA